MGNAAIIKPVLIDGLLKTAAWYRDGVAGYLQSVFDQVGFIDRKQGAPKYCAPPVPLSSKVRYPIRSNMEELAAAKGETLELLNRSYGGLAPEYLEKLTSSQLLFLLEKFGANVPYDDKCRVAIFDRYKLLAAKEVLESNRKDSDPGQGLLIAADISGIQRFIYNIAAKGALKNLRARSFYIELLCHHTIARILEAFNLHPVNVLMNGGGNFHILSHCPSDYEERLNDIDFSLNKWLFKEFNGLLHVTICAVPWTSGDPIEDLLEGISMKLWEKKNRKFEVLIKRDALAFVDDADPGYERCDVCYKDGSLEEFREIIDNDGRGTGSYRCGMCDQLVRLGAVIPKARYVYFCKDMAANCICIENTIYKISDERENLEVAWNIYADGDGFINDLGAKASPILAHTCTKTVAEVQEYVRNSGKTYEDAEPGGMATLEQIADSSIGAAFIGALRMDADNMGRLIQHGFYEGITLECLSSFSRNVNYFFRLYLDSICREGFQHGTSGPLAIRAGGRIVQVIYAGGDDLFAIGAWNDAAALAVDVSKAFKKYTCDNIDVGISAGFTLHQPRVPVIKMADESAAALDCAKHELQPCWMCRTKWKDCRLLENGRCLRKGAYAPFYTGYLAHRKSEIDEHHKVTRQEQSSRLTLALKWEKIDKSGSTYEVENYLLQPLQTLYRARFALKRGFFHNALQLLDIWYEEGMLYLPRLVWSFDKIRRELKGREGGEEEESLYDLLMMHLHVYDPDQKDGNKKFATLHMPLSWMILLERGGA
ncbi:MAG TPA: type III-A CRISPR-associated protein Cas10/Csm1 [Syntrophales bacterium]|nr:type III-A CRISPR-associated protein Cas10/Csm1 [Syntrophales bacterium]